MMHHIDIDTLIDYLHHELSPSDDAKVLAHLENCEACARELDVEASITDRLRAAARSEELEPAASMRNAILKRIADLRPSPWERLGAWARPLAVVPVAAALAAAAFFLGPAIGQQTPPKDALPVSYYMQQYAVHAQQNPLSDRGTMVMTSFDDGAR